MSGKTTHPFKAERGPSVPKELPEKEKALYRQGYTVGWEAAATTIWNNILAGKITGVKVVREEK